MVGLVRKMKCGEIEGDVLKIEEELVVVEKNWRHDIFFLFFFFLSFYVSAGIMPRDEETAQTELKRRTRDGNFLWRKLIRREKSLSLSLAGEDFCCGKRTK